MSKGHQDMVSSHHEELQTDLGAMPAKWSYNNVKNKASIFISKWTNT